MPIYLTTKGDFKRITRFGCRTCHSKDFKYYSVLHIYEWQNCKSQYATDAIGILNILNDETIQDIKLYHKRDLLDDDSIKTDLKILKRKKSLSKKL